MEKERTEIRKGRKRQRAGYEDGRDKEWDGEKETESREGKRLWVVLEGWVTRQRK
jgi:hypothetical protein